MSTPIQYPAINGNGRHTWAAVEINVAGQVYYCTAANYSRKRNRTMVRVNHSDPIDKTIGENEYSADVEMLVAEYNALQAALIAQANQAGLNGGYGDVRFKVTVQYSSPGLDTVTVTILGCTMDSTDSSNAQGPDPSKIKFDLSPLKVLINGQDDLAIPLKAPPGS